MNSQVYETVVAYFKIHSYIFTSGTEENHGQPEGSGRIGWGSERKPQIISRKQTETVDVDLV
jgi:hypothetical protein